MNTPQGLAIELNNALGELEAIVDIITKNEMRLGFNPELENTWDRCSAVTRRLDHALQQNMMDERLSEANRQAKY